MVIAKETQQTNDGGGPLKAPQVAVGAFVVKDNRILLVNRKYPPGKGLWAIPGGRVKLGETLQEAVEREVKEETGIIVKARSPVYAFDVIERNEKNTVQFHYVIVDCMADYVSGKLVAGDDALEARWISHEELDALPVSESTKTALEKLRLLP
jgi:ADP-ribose pyrophosphatase